VHGERPGAGVLHIAEARIGGDATSLVIANTELQPQRLRADRNGLSRDVRGLVGGSEHVDEVDRLGHVSHA
jgi:hypothetical protein